MDKTLQANFDYSSYLEPKKDKSRYLVAFALTLSAICVKAPYLYTLFMIVHQFTMTEIGILCLVVTVASLGPITGQLAVKY